MHRSLFVVAALLSLMGARAQTPPPLLARPPETHEVSVVLSDEQRHKSVLASPKPEYPVEALRRHLTGRGVFQLTLSGTGEVASVDVLTSTGYSILDRAAIKALKLWKFRPHEFVRVKMPITFTMTGNPVVPKSKKEKT